MRDTITAAGGAWADERRFRFAALDVIVTTQHYPDALKRATVVMGMAGGFYGGYTTTDFTVCLPWVVAGPAVSLSAICTRIGQGSRSACRPGR